MSNRVIAISTGVYYLDKTKWCVKDLKIGYRKDGTPFWFVSGIGCNFDNEKVAKSIAVDTARSMKVPYILNVVHGEVITGCQRTVLKMYGITVK